MVKRKKEYLKEKDIFNHIFFSPSISKARSYLKRNHVKYKAVKLFRKQLQHSDKWKTYQYTPKRKK